MKDKVYYSQELNMINLYPVRQDEWWNSKNEAKSRKIGSQIFQMYVGGWISFILNQNGNHGLILNLNM